MGRESFSLVIGEKKYPMSWTEGSVWTVTLDKVTVASLKDYGYILIKAACRQGGKDRPVYLHLPLSVLTDEKASELNIQIEGLLKDSGRFVSE